MLGLAAELLANEFENPATDIEAKVVPSALFPRKKRYTAVDVGRNQPRHLTDSAGPPNDVRPMTDIVELPETLVVSEIPLHPKDAKNAEF